MIPIERQTIKCKSCKRELPFKINKVVKTKKRTFAQIYCPYCKQFILYSLSPDHLFSNALYHQPAKVNFHKAIANPITHKTGGDRKLK